MMLVPRVSKSEESACIGIYTRDATGPQVWV